jgi:ubiquinol-cytochrome c reductase cytochrome c subunit
MMRRYAVIALIALASCTYTSADDEPDIYRPPGLAQAPSTYDGKELYMRDCAWCHGSSGQGTRYAPDITTGTNGPAAIHFMISSGRMPIDSPDQDEERSETVYSNDEIDKILAFTRTFEHAGPDIPIVDLESASLADGGKLYTDNCAACHGSGAIGAAITSGATAPELMPASATEVAEAIRIGPPGMPVFGPETFDDQQLNDIVAYVEYLKDPEDRGGASLGHVGPVSEGMVAWLVGLLALLLIVRWIGTTADE